MEMVSDSLYVEREGRELLRGETEGSPVEVGHSQLVSRRGTAFNLGQDTASFDLQHGR